MHNKESKFSDLFENAKAEKQTDTAPRAADTLILRSMNTTQYAEDIDPKVVDPVPSSYRHDSIDRVRLRRLKKYCNNEKYRLDLHGYTRKSAVMELIAHIDRCRKEGIIYFLVIFGRGLSLQQGPILKKTVCSYLIDSQEVLAYQFAVPKDGGDGAAYVMLKKR